MNALRSSLLLVAAVLAVLVGLAHSVLGEKYILMCLPEQGKFKDRTMRFAWHLTTIAWWGFGAMLALAARGMLTPTNTLFVLAVTMITTAGMILIVSRGRHLAWPVFFAIAIISFWAAA
ncbi:MAG: hypothetical protein OEW16_06345 [Gammaproteobacteria bacterium]|nr:hypothetical protein [Gammaproteobacteria bacterium]